MAMAMEFEFTSRGRESAEPAASTLVHHPNNFCKFSSSDQTSLYVPITLFYPRRKRASQAATFAVENSQLVKQSLAQILSRIFSNIDEVCSRNFEDEIYYVEARVKCHISKFLRGPNCSVIQQFLPSFASLDGVRQPLAMIQMNLFDCGGIAIGARFSHLILEQIDIGTFLKDWATIARGSCGNETCHGFTPDYPLPYHEISLQTELNVTRGISSWPNLSKERGTTRRVVFDSEAIASLKTITTSSKVPNPTSVEAISALIWKCIMAASRSKSGVSKPSLFTLSTKSRKTAAALCNNESSADLDSLVHELRVAIRKASGCFPEKLQDDINEYVKPSNGMNCIGCNSWWNSGLYEVEFGWGRPAWVTSVGYSKSEPLYMTNVVLIETRWGDGVEAWVTLDEQEMSMLETNKELLTFATVTF